MRSGNTGMRTASRRAHRPPALGEIELLRRMPLQERILFAHDYNETASLEALRFLRDHDAMETIRDAAARSIALRTER